MQKKIPENYPKHPRSALMFSTSYVEGRRGVDSSQGEKHGHGPNKPIRRRNKPLLSPSVISLIRRQSNTTVQLPACTSTELKAILSLESEFHTPDNTKQNATYAIRHTIPIHSTTAHQTYASNTSRDITIVSEEYNKHVKHTHAT